jgi:SAM-dependent methyltransferase
VVGSEVHVAGLAIARERLPGATLVQLDATAMPFTACFDAIGAFDVIEHIADAEAALAGIRRALRPGGIAVFSVPQHRWLWSRADVLAHHQRRYARGELEGRLRALGFGIVWSGSFNSLLLPVLWLARKRPAPADPLAEFRLPRPLQALFGAVMAVEYGLTRLGLRWPAGGSRVVVARAQDKPGTPAG